MTCDPKDMRLHPRCELCDNHPATELQGGIHFVTDKRKLWFCCKICKQRIIDERKNKEV